MASSAIVRYFASEWVGSPEVRATDYARQPRVPGAPDVALDVFGLRISTVRTPRFLDPEVRLHDLALVPDLAVLKIRRVPRIKLVDRGLAHRSNASADGSISVLPRNETL
jgi:hypothetical protein